MPSLHSRTHPSHVEGCWACKAASIGVTPSALGALEPARKQRGENQLVRDRAAYYDLRHAGLQPPHVDGSERLAETKIEGQFDIDYAGIIAREDRGAAKEAIMASKEAGLIP